jgi:RimJ/RimL family protein N-acetyltransferase
MNDNEFDAVVETTRLELVLMSVPLMEALKRRDLEAATAELGAEVPAWLADDMQDFLDYRLAQLREDPSVHNWLGRVMVLTEEDGSRRVIGSIGFHGAPDEEGRLEIGYRVDPSYRNRGFARESATAMYRWAHDKHGISRFLGSISPDNIPSLNLIEEYGYVLIGEHMDDIDGLELVFEMNWPPSRVAAAAGAVGDILGDGTIETSTETDGRYVIYYSWPDDV